MVPVSRSTDSLADILERVLDKGVVIAGDIMVNVLDIELLTLKIRLLIASVDTARDMGIDWWRSDPFLTGNNALERENRELRGRVERLEQLVQRAGLPAEEIEREYARERAELEGMSDDRYATRAHARERSPRGEEGRR